VIDGDEQCPGQKIERAKPVHISRLKFAAGKHNRRLDGFFKPAALIFSRCCL